MSVAGEDDRIPESPLRLFGLAPGKKSAIQISGLWINSDVPGSQGPTKSREKMGVGGVTLGCRWN
jgi:hypothetical protein